MRIKQGFELRDIAGERVVQAFGLDNIDYTKLIQLNETSAYLWEKLVGRDFTLDDCVALLRLEYNEVPDNVADDIRRMLEDWRKEGLLED